MKTPKRSMSSCASMAGKYRRKNYRFFDNYHETNKQMISGQLSLSTWEKKCTQENEVNLSDVRSNERLNASHKSCKSNS